MGCFHMIFLKRLLGFKAENLHTVVIGMWLLSWNNNFFKMCILRERNLPHYIKVFRELDRHLSGMV